MICIPTNQISASVLSVIFEVIRLYYFMYTDNLVAKLEFYVSA
jgi:hypothetical protein